MNIIVLMKQTPDTAQLSGTVDGFKLSEYGGPRIVNPWDEYAIETAMPSVKSCIQKAPFTELPFADNEFDFVIAIGPVDEPSVCKRLSKHWLRAIRRGGGRHSPEHEAAAGHLGGSQPAKQHRLAVWSGMGEPHLGGRAAAKIDDLNCGRLDLGGGEPFREHAVQAGCGIGLVNFK